MSTAPLIDITDIRHGWATIRWDVASDDPLIMTIANDGDGLGELVEAVFAVVTGRKLESSCEWSNEPGFFVLRLHTFESQVAWAISYVDDDHRKPAGGPYEPFQGTCRPRDLAGRVLLVFLKFSLEYPGEEYRRRWGFAFPDLRLCELERWVREESGAVRRETKKRRPRT